MTAPNGEIDLVAEHLYGVARHQARPVTHDDFVWLAKRMEGDGLVDNAEAAASIMRGASTVMGDPGWSTESTRDYCESLAHALRKAGLVTEPALADRLWWVVQHYDRPLGRADCVALAQTLSQWGWVTNTAGAQTAMWRALPGSRGASCLPGPHDCARMIWELREHGLLRVR